jgi:hypothetical protein
VTEDRVGLPEPPVVSCTQLSADQPISPAAVNFLTSPFPGSKIRILGQTGAVHI